MLFIDEFFKILRERQEKKALSNGADRLHGDNEHTALLQSDAKESDERKKQR